MEKNILKITPHTSPLTTPTLLQYFSLSTPYKTYTHPHQFFLLFAKHTPTPLSLSLTFLSILYAYIYTRLYPIWTLKEIIYFPIPSLSWKQPPIYPNPALSSVLYYSVQTQTSICGIRYCRHPILFGDPINVDPFNSLLLSLAILAAIQIICLQEHLIVDGNYHTNETNEWQGWQG